MKNDCIIPAAGFSSRMGFWKPSLPIDGIPMICRTVSNALKHTGRIIVVGGYNFEKLADLLKGIPNLILLENRSFKKGMMTSLKTAVDYVETESFFVTLADMPFIKPDTYEKLNHYQVEDALFPVFQGRRGHPVLINSSLIPLILSAPEEIMMRDLLINRKTKEIEVPDSGILIDLDNPRDIERYKEKS
jgi:molybdenum cofactor cytidylyltransferase